MLSLGLGLGLSQRDGSVLGTGDLVPSGDMDDGSDFLIPSGDMDSGGDNFEWQDTI